MISTTTYQCKLIFTVRKIKKSNTANDCSPKTSTGSDGFDKMFLKLEMSPVIRQTIVFMLAKQLFVFVLFVSVKSEKTLIHLLTVDRGGFTGSEQNQVHSADKQTERLERGWNTDP